MTTLTTTTNIVNSNGNLFEDMKKIPIRDFDPDPAVAEAELRLRIAEIKAMIARLDEAQLVTQETLQLEFSI